MTCFLIGPKLYLLYSFYWVAWLQHEAGTCSFFHIASALIIACACRIPASSNWAVGKIWSRQIKKINYPIAQKPFPDFSEKLRTKIEEEAVSCFQLHLNCSTLHLDKCSSWSFFYYMQFTNSWVLGLFSACALFPRESHIASDFAKFRFAPSCGRQQLRIG